MASAGAGAGTSAAASAPAWRPQSLRAPPGTPHEPRAATQRRPPPAAPRLRLGPATGSPSSTGGLITGPGTTPERGGSLSSSAPTSKTTDNFLFLAFGFLGIGRVRRLSCSGRARSKRGAASSRPSFSSSASAARHRVLAAPARPARLDRTARHPTQRRTARDPRWSWPSRRSWSSSQSPGPSSDSPLGTWRASTIASTRASRGPRTRRPFEVFPFCQVCKAGPSPRAVPDLMQKLPSFAHKGSVLIAALPFSSASWSPGKSNPCALTECRRRWAIV